MAFSLCLAGPQHSLKSHRGRHSWKVVYMHQINIRVSTEEKYRLMLVADLLGLSLSEFAKRTILKQARSVIDASTTTSIDQQNRNIK